MKRAEHEASYSAFVVSRQDHLRRIAYALCGSWHDADDLLQVALTKLYTAWPRVADGNPEAYVRSILMRANIDAYRLAAAESAPLASTQPAIQLPPRGCRSTNATHSSKAFSDFPRCNARSSSSATGSASTSTRPRVSSGSPKVP